MARAANDEPTPVSSRLTDTWPVRLIALLLGAAILAVGAQLLFDKLYQADGSFDAVTFLILTVGIFLVGMVYLRR